MRGIQLRSDLYREGQHGPELLGSKCRDCGKIVFPKRKICPQCFKEGVMEEVPLTRRGKLYTYTIIRQGPKGFQTPYATCFVDLPEGVRVFSQLTTSDPNEIRIGMDVELVVGKVRSNEEGNDIISFKFKPY